MRLIEAGGWGFCPLEKPLIYCPVSASPLTPAEWRAPAIGTKQNGTLPQDRDVTARGRCEWKHHIKGAQELRCDSRQRIKASARKLGRLINLVIALDQFIRGRRYLEAAFEAFLPRRCPLLALSGHWLVHRTCPLSGVKRTSKNTRFACFYANLSIEFFLGGFF